MRDKETCRFFGYHRETLEVVNYDGNYQNNKPKNMLTACVFCARCTLLDSYKLEYKGGDRIIFLPELTQTELNTLCRVLFVETLGDANSESAYNAKTLISQLLDRGTFLDEKAKCQISHPGLFLYYLNSNKKKPEFVNKLRWLPDPNEYKDTIKIWQHEQDQVQA